MTPLLKVENLSITFAQHEAPIQAVDNISFHLNQGETLGIVGESGSGKSVTALSIMRLLPKSSAIGIKGHIEFDGVNILSLTEREMNRLRGNDIGMIFQEPMNSLNPLHTVGKQVRESLQQHQGLDPKDAHERALELLSEVGIKQPKLRINAYPHELSGGQCQRIMIAIALANNPKLLIADEPTTAIDVTIQAQILALLRTLQEKFNMGILLISHDLNVVKHNAHRVCVMNSGAIVECNDTQRLYQSPQAEYTHALLNAEPTGQPAPLPVPHQPLLTAQAIKVWFPVKTGFFKRTTDYIKAVDDIDIDLNVGETLGIVGESGSGKTTLAHALLRLQTCEGAICFNQRSLHQLSQKQVKPYRKDFQLVFQNPFSSLSPRMSVQQIIEEGLTVHHPELSPQDRTQRVISALQQVELKPEFRHRYPHEFSGGQRQRIAIARSLILKPKLIILDEPTSALDRLVQKQIIELLRSLQAGHQLSYICISHDLAVVRAMSHRVVVMQQGRIVESGNTDAVFTAPQRVYTQTLIRAAYL